MADITEIVKKVDTFKSEAQRVEQIGEELIRQLSPVLNNPTFQAKIKDFRDLYDKLSGDACTHGLAGNPEIEQDYNRIFLENKQLTTLWTIYRDLVKE